MCCFLFVVIPVKLGIIGVMNRSQLDINNKKVSCISFLVSFFAPLANLTFSQATCSDSNFGCAENGARAKRKMRGGKEG